MHILEIWRATVDFCYRDGAWTWGGRIGRNSISDAEQLLTILYPATVIESLGVDSVDQTADDVLEYLRSLGNALDIPRRLIKFIDDYMRTYSVDGTPDFSGGTYFEPAKGEAADGEAAKDEAAKDEAADGEAAEVAPSQRKLHVVDSYSMSVTLCLSALGFLRVYRPDVRSPKTLKRSTSWRALLAAADRGHGRPAAQLHREHLRPERPARSDDVHDDQPERCRHRDPRP